MSLHSLLNAGAKLHKKLQSDVLEMLKSHKMIQIWPFFHLRVLSIEENLLPLRSEFVLFGYIGPIVFQHPLKIPQ